MVENKGTAGVTRGVVVEAFYNGSSYQKSKSVSMDPGQTRLVQIDLQIPTSSSKSIQKEDVETMIYFLGNRPQVTPPGAGTASQPTPTQTATETVAAAPTPMHLVGAQGTTGVQAYLENKDNPTLLERNYGVEWEQYTVEIPVNIVEALYEYYSNRIRTPNYGGYVSDSLAKTHLSAIAKSARNYQRRQDLSESELLNLMVNFVQSLEYTKDVNEAYDEYPKYPLETLAERGGDCEDTAILLVAILKSLDRDAVLFRMPNQNHMGVGIAGVDNPGGTGAHVKRDGKRYFYAETTGEGWAIGQIPDDYKGASVKIDRPTNHPSLVFSWTVAPPKKYQLPINVEIANMGDAKARQANLKAFVEKKDGSVVASGKTDTVSVPADGSINGRADVKPIPAPNEPYRLLFQVGIQGRLHDEMKTDLIKPT